MPRLYVVPTPIGNLEDMTLRGLRVLREVSLVLAEDTRHTSLLFRHFDIHTPLLSYHQHNKRARIRTVVERLRDGDVAVVSDAGMPAISDPGFELVAACVEAGIEVDVLPGASAVTTAVAAAAIPAPGFIFLGFLPRRGRERLAHLERVRDLPYALVLFESTQRLNATLRDLAIVLGDRQMVAARELTKLHQELIRGTVTSVSKHFELQAARGELTLVIAGSEVQLDRTEEALQELGRRRAAGEDRRTVLEGVAREYGVGRNILYRSWLSMTSRNDRE